MIAFLVRRLAVSFVILLLVSFLTFGIIWLVPGDAASVFLETSATPEQLDQIRRQLGLDQPFHVQVLSWYSRVLRGDFGNSIFLQRSVLAAITERLPVTLSLIRHRTGPRHGAGSCRRCAGRFEARSLV